MGSTGAATSPSDIQIIVPAVCTLIGAVAAAVFSNWDKIFNKNKVVQAQVVGYTPTDNLETEIRMMLELTGTRASIDDLQTRLFAQIEANLMANSPGAANEIKNLLGIYKEEMPDYDDFVKLLVPIWQKYYSLSAVQEINKFYSTATIRDFLSKNKHVMEEYWPHLQAMIAKSQERAEQRLERSYEPLDVIPPRPSLGDGLPAG